MLPERLRDVECSPHLQPDRIACGGFTMPILRRNAFQKVGKSVFLLPDRHNDDLSCRSFFSTFPHLMKCGIAIIERHSRSRNPEPSVILLLFVPNGANLGQRSRTQHLLVGRYHITRIATKVSAVPVVVVEAP